MAHGIGPDRADSCAVGDATTIWVITAAVTAVPVAILVAYALLARRSVAAVRQARELGVSEVELIGGIDMRGWHVPVPFARMLISAEEVVIAPRRIGRFEPVRMTPADARRGELTRSLLLLFTYLGPRGRVRFTTLSRRAMCEAMVLYDWDVVGVGRACGRWGRSKTAATVGDEPPGSSGQLG